jgi:uncharacterized tellurite resistance protein B-like protein
MDKIELFSNLVNLAAADNRFTEEEIRFLVDRADRWGISNDEFETIMAGISETGIELRIPESHASRVELLKELIRLMAADGEMAEVEKSLCARASSKMDLTTRQFQDIVDELIHKN